MYSHHHTPLVKVAAVVTAARDPSMVDPFYWIRETLRFGRICAVKYPVSARTLPVIVSTAAGVAFLSITGSSQAPATPVPARTVVARREDASSKWDQVKVDPYDKAAVRMAKVKAQREAPRPGSAEWVRQLRESVAKKTRSEKLRDAGIALGEFVKGPPAK